MENIVILFVALITLLQVFETFYFYIAYIIGWHSFSNSYLFPSIGFSVVLNQLIVWFVIFLSPAVAEPLAFVSSYQGEDSPNHLQL